MDYWKECISEAFEDAGIAATDEQIENVAGWAESAHDHYGQAFGHARQSPVETTKDREIAELKRQIKELEGDISIFRRSVARRKNVSEANVYLERHRHGVGDVMFSER